MQSWPLNQYYMQADSLPLNHAFSFGSKNPFKCTMLEAIFSISEVKRYICSSPFKTEEDEQNFDLYSSATWAV